MLQKKKNDFNDKLVFKIKFITIKDYDQLNPYEAVLYDKRGFFEMFYHKLKQEHAIFNLLFYESVMEPLWLRLTYFYFYLSLIFCLNAFFFNDEYIDARAELPKSVRVSIFVFNLLNLNVLG